jgi:hypothetical protein
MLEETLQIRFRNLARLYNDGFRCRFDGITLEHIPLKEGEVMCDKELCPNCTWDGRSEDEFCVEYQKAWKVLGEYDGERYGPGEHLKEAT